MIIDDLVFNFQSLRLESQMSNAYQPVKELLGRFVVVLGTDLHVFPFFLWFSSGPATLDDYPWWLGSEKSLTQVSVSIKYVAPGEGLRIITFDVFRKSYLWWDGVPAFVEIVFPENLITFIKRMKRTVADRYTDTFFDLLNIVMFFLSHVSVDDFLLTFTSVQ